MLDKWQCMIYIPENGHAYTPKTPFSGSCTHGTDRTV
jgi:hypothetical protein